MTKGQPAKWRYVHAGTLFESLYEVRLVKTDRHLRHLCRYIHANPVKDGIALAPALWPCSNYLEWIDQWQGTLVDQEFVTHCFSEPQQEYVTFVQDYLTRREVDAEIERYLSELENR